MTFLETSDCTDESRKDGTCLQFKMKKHYASYQNLKKTLINIYVYEYAHSFVGVDSQSDVLCWNLLAFVGQYLYTYMYEYCLNIVYICIYCILYIYIYICLGVFLFALSPRKTFPVQSHKSGVK